MQANVNTLRVVASQPLADSSARSVLFCDSLGNNNLGDCFFGSPRVIHNIRWASPGRIVPQDHRQLIEVVRLYQRLELAA